MMTRAQVSESYTLNRAGRVTSPGKFEQEPWWVVALWEASLDGDHDREDYDGDTLLVSYAIAGEVNTMLGDIKGADDPDPRDFVTLYEREDGFVCCTFTLAEDLDACASEGE